MVKTKSGATVAVGKYFEAKYPYSVKGSSIGFGAGAEERLQLIAACVTPLSGKSLCDLGCGSGVLVEGLIRIAGIPTKLLLVDISNTAILMAVKRLSRYQMVLESSSQDALLGSGGHRHDIVLAIGLSDYYEDWDELLTVVLGYARELTIIDFPRSWRPRNLLRRLWLWRNGVSLRTTSYGELCRFLDRHAVSYSIERSQYNWIVQIFRAQ